MIDFGVAYHPKISSGETMVGTIQYCDPRILAAQSPDFYSDLYSTALLILKLLTGEEMWPNLAPLPLYRKIQKRN